MSFRYICVEGNIGAGKTTFVKRFAEISEAIPIYERFSENPFLESFYKNPKQFAFPLEMSFLAERFQQLNDIFSKPNLFESSYISDYTFLKTLIFARQNLNQEESVLFQTFYKTLSSLLPQPEWVIYLQTPIEQAFANIHSRGRKMELSLQQDYLLKIEKSYTEVLLQPHRKNVIISPYHEEKWHALDEIIYSILDNLTTNRLKPGIFTI